MWGEIAGMDAELVGWIRNLRSFLTYGIAVSVKQYRHIKAPILLIFGAEEPFYPKKISGLKDLKKDMIRPFYEEMKRAGCPVSVKLYKGCGHFPHNDAPELFGRDVVDFVLKGEVEGRVDPGIF